MRYSDEYYFYDEALLPKDPVFVEIGSVTGKNAISLKKRYPSARMIVYEASEAWWDLFNEVNQSGLDIEVVNKAVSDIRGPISFYEYDTVSSNSIYQRNRKNERIYTKESVTPKDIITEHGLSHIDVLFMNCEGAEYQILHWLMQNKLDVRQIAVSFHPQIYGNDKMNEVKDGLIEQGYQVISGSGKYHYYLIKKADDVYR